MDFHITEEKWQVILKELKEEKGIHKSNEYALRIFIEGVYCIMKSGSQWRLLPKCYRNWRAVHMRFIEKKVFGVGYTNSAVLADKGYDSNVLVEIIKANHSIAVIPSDKNRKEQREYNTDLNADLYKERNWLNILLLSVFLEKLNTLEEYLEEYFPDLIKRQVLIWGFCHLLVSLCGSENFLHRA